MTASPLDEGTAPWVDQNLGAELPRLVRAGEGQQLEFKREFPAQARDFAKVVASFATSGDGLILLGVSDEGEVLGLQAMESSMSRDALVARIAGSCQGVDPPVRPTFSWATINEQIVLGVRVSKGTDPLYYVEGRPYLRHLSISRPAKPAEVIDAVRVWFAQQSAAGSSSEASEFYLELAGTLARVLRWGAADPRSRSLRPAIDEWTIDASRAAETLRDLASGDVALEADLSERLHSAAASIGHLAELHHTFSSASDFEQIVATATEAAQRLMDDVISPMRMQNEAIRRIQAFLRKSARKLRDSWSRAHIDPFGQALEDARSESTQVGRQLSEWSFYPLQFLTETEAEEMRELGNSLVELGDRHLHTDGGESQRRVAEDGLETVAALQRFADLHGVRDQ